jgi:hypothetical protein
MRLEVRDAQSKLPQVVAAARFPGRFPRRLDSRHQQPSQDAHDRNHHKQLEQGKTLSTARTIRQTTAFHGEAFPAQK